MCTAVRWGWHECIRVWTSVCCMLSPPLCHLHFVILSYICLMLIRRKARRLSWVSCQLFYQAKLSSYSGIPWSDERGSWRHNHKFTKAKQRPFSLLKGVRPKMNPCWKGLSGCFSVTQAADTVSFLSEIKHYPSWILPGPLKGKSWRGIKKRGEKGRIVGGGGELV